MSRLYTRKNIIISFIIIAIVVLFTAYFTYRSNREAHWQTERVKESQQSMQVIEDLMDDLQDIETGQRGFFITRTPYFLEPYSIALKKIPADTQAVRNLIPLYPQRRGMISSLLGSTRRKLDVSNAIVDLVRAGKYDSAQRVIFSGAGKQFMDSIRQITDLILKQDRALFLKSELQRQEASRNSAILLISLLSLSLGVLSWLLWQYFIGESMRRDNREKLQYLARLTEQAGDAIFSTNLSGLILSWNTGAEKLFGYSKEQVTGKFIPGIKLGGFSLDQISKLTGQGIENEPITIEGYHLNRDQNGFDYSASITTLNNEKNEQTGFLILLRDITERKKAEKLLSRFNEELAMQVEEKTALVRNVVGRIRDGFYSLDNEWRFTYVNEYMYELTGKTPGELMGHTIWEAFPDVVNTPAHEALTFAVREQKQQAIDFYFPPLGKWFSSQLYPSPTGISVFFRDVSEVKNAEMEIRRSNERFNLIGRTTRDAIWEWNCETGEIWGNEVHQQLYGLTLEDPVPSEKEWQNRLHPDDRERIIDEQEKALASDRNVFITEYRFRTDFNGYRDIYGRSYIVRNAEGKATRLLGNMMDITERKKAESALKESEEKLRHILSSSVDDFYVIDLDYQVILINHTAQRNLELAWGKKVTSGALILDLLPPERKDYIKNNYDLVFKGEKINYDYPVPFPGGVLWKNVEYGPVRNEEGVITGAFVTSVDITAKKNAEEELLESYRAIRELSGHLQNIREEERSNIAREIHDELGQQLTVLKMDISWLMGKWQGKDEKVAERLSGLLEMIDNTVKSVRRISSELRPSMLDDLGLSAAIEWHTQDFGKRMGIGIRTMVETGEVKLPERVNISLFRVLQECLTNVARHAKATEITVRLYQQDDHMNLEIQDNGVGFLKAEVTNKKTLGILGMKERIALIKGNYSIDSILGKGTLVRVSVPVSPTT